MSPQTIGSYQILQELGRGGMGIVYQCYDARIGRPVAIKVIRLDPGATADDSAELRQRLVREASAAGKLSHPGIVTVYQLGEDGPNVFVAMEFVKGTPLETLLKDQTGRDQKQMLEILRQVAEALDYAHQAGVVHRDIKPANILVREDGTVKVADFGIAKMTETAKHTLTATGASLGSPAYMSPEQVRAEQVDGRSDQFSLGIMTYRILTGSLPFPGDTAHAVMYQIIAGDPFAAQSAGAALPPHVKAALGKALAKEPKDRFPTCAAFIRELSNAGQIPTATVAAPPPRKRSLLLPAVLVLAVLAALAGYWLLLRKPANAPVASPAEKASVPLIKAIEEGRVDDVKSLIAKGADVNAANADGATALMVAAEGSGYLPNNAPVVDLLLQKGAQVDAHDHRGRTALYRAAAEGKEEAMRFLLAHKANPNHKANDGSTTLLQTITFGRAAAMNLLLASGANADLADSQGATPLMLAAEGTGYMPNNAVLVRALLDKGAKIDAQDSRGRTALHRAAAEGKTEAVRLLLDAKANPNAGDASGETPLLNAVTFGRQPVMQLLLERGADVNLADTQGNTPLLVAAEGTGYLPNNGPFVAALLAAKAKVDAQDARGRAPLYRAAAEGKEEAMRLLLEKGANPNLRAGDGSTPLLQAVTFGRLAAATLLLNRGADVDLADAGGNTPLMVAAEGNPYIKSPADFVTLLLTHAAKPGLSDSRGRNALTRATESKNTAAIELLQKK